MYIFTTKKKQEQNLQKYHKATFLSFCKKLDRNY